MATAQQIAELSVPITGDPRQLDAALARAESRMRAFNQQLGRTPAGAGRSSGIDTSTANAARASAQAAQEDIKLASARQRLAAVTEQARAATARANAAESAAAATATRAEQAVQRLAAAKERAAAASQRAAAGGNTFTSSLRETAGRVDGLIGTLSSLGGAFAVVGAAQGVLSLAQTGAAAEAARKSFDSLAASAGQSGAQLLASLQSAAAGTVAQTDLIKSSNTALLLLGSDVASQLPKLLEVAKASATALGTDVGAVFDSLVTGIARGSTELIDNAGITLKAGDAYAAYAASIGKTADSLSAAEKQQAILNGVLTAGQDIVAQTAGAGDTSAIAFQRAAAAGSDLTTALGTLLAQGLAPAAQGFANLATAATNGITQVASYGAQVAAVGQQVLTSATSYDDYLAKLAFVNSQLGVFGTTLTPLTAAQFAFSQSLSATGTTGEAVAAQLATLGATTDLYASALSIAGKTSAEAAAQVQALEPAILAVAGASDAGRVGVETLLQSFYDGVIGVDELRAGLEALAAAEQEKAVAASASASASLVAASADIDRADAAAFAAAANDADTAAALAHTAALNEDAVAALLSAANSDELTAAKQVLADQARITAQQLLASGDAGAAAAARLAQSSSKVDQLTAAYYRLEAAQRGAASVPEGRSERDTQADRAAIGSQKALDAQRERLQAAAAAERKASGGGAAARRSAGGGGGGSAASSAASKAATAAEKAAEKQAKAEEALKEKLLDINERFYDESAKAEEAYQESKLKIIEAYNEKQKKAQEDLVVSSKQSRFNFYKGLKESDVPPEVRAQLAAAYEQAFAQAQQYSQEGKAALAADFLALKQEQLAAELDYQKELAAAREAGNKEEIASLEALNRLRLEAEQAKLDQLLAGGDQNVADRDADLTDAEQKRQADLAAAATKVGEATAAAQDKGRTATDLQNVSLAEQLALLDQIAARGGAASPARPGTGTAPAGAPGAAAPSTTAAALNGASPGAAPTPVADAAVAAAIAQLREATASGLAGVERAVKSVNVRPNYGPGG